MRAFELLSQRLIKPLQRAQFWGYALMDGLRQALPEARRLLNLIPGFWQPPPPSGGGVPAGRNGDDLDQDEITNRTDAPEAPSHHRQRPLIALFDPWSSPARSWIPLARHTAAGGGALDVGVGPGFRGLTERPIASQSQAWKVFIRPIPFIAMPFTRQMDDVYYFGIEAPVHNAGLLRSRIETASVVIADLTGANPNVYLEVGYAWGKGRPTILLVQDVGDLRFDVKSQRGLVYDRIIDLARLLSNKLQHMHNRGLLQLPKTGT